MVYTWYIYIYIWNTHGIHMEHIWMTWSTHGIHMAYTWHTHRNTHDLHIAYMVGQTQHHDDTSFSFSVEPLIIYVYAIYVHVYPICMPHVCHVYIYVNHMYSMCFPCPLRVCTAICAMCTPGAFHARAMFTPCVARCLPCECHVYAVCTRCVCHPCAMCTPCALHWVCYVGFLMSVRGPNLIRNPWLL